MAYHMVGFVRPSVALSGLVAPDLSGGQSVRKRTSQSIGQNID